MTVRVGTLRGLDACASPRGTFTVLALDHRQNLRRELRADDPESVTHDEMVAFKRTVVRALGETATGVLLDPEMGAAQAIFDRSLPPATGLIVALEATGYLGLATARVSRVLPDWSVAKARCLGADGVKLLLYYHPEAANAAGQEGLLADVARACADADLPLFLEPLCFSLEPSVPKLTGDARRDVVVETARRLTAIGGDVLKAEFPYDPSVTDPARWADACARIDAASTVPWVILSGGVDDATFEEQVRVACRAGASGVMVGRSVWAGAAALPRSERPGWLASEGRSRLRRVAEIVDDAGLPWRERSSLTRSAQPGEGWYRDYPG